MVRGNAAAVAAVMVASMMLTGSLGLPDLGLVGPQEMAGDGPTDGGEGGGDYASDEGRSSARTPNGNAWGRDHTPPPPGLAKKGGSDPEPPELPYWPNSGEVEVMDVALPATADGSMITLTVHKPMMADAEHQFPVILHSHGFTGSRSTDPGAFQALVASGFAVVSFDERGHGQRKDTTVEFMQPDREVADVIDIIDHIATYDWVLLDAPGDPRLGAIGGSYGGAFQTMTAVFDDRLDSLVPEITWNSITHALAPNEVINSAWVDLFYAAGNTISPITFNDEFHRGFAWALATNELPAGQVPGIVPDLVQVFDDASPSSYPGAIDVPALFIQGMTDSLFPLGHAAANYGLVGATGAPVGLYTHRGGHLVPGGSHAVGPAFVGFQGSSGTSSCGELVDLQIAWHLKHVLLRPEADTGPTVCLSLDDGTSLAGDDFPLPQTEWVSAAVEAPTGALVVPSAPVGAGIEIPIWTPEVDSAVAGIPRLSGTVTAPTTDAVVFFTLVAEHPDGTRYKVDDQVQPMRWRDAPIAQEFALDLKGVATALPAGSTLSLLVSNWDPLFGTNAGRVPAAVVLEDLVVDLPTVPL